MPPRNARAIQLARARETRSSGAEAPADAATRRVRPRRTSTPLDAAAAVEGLGDVDMVVPDSPTVELTSNSAEASTEETRPVAVSATMHGSGSHDADVDAPAERKRGALSQTSALASQASSAAVTMKRGPVQFQKHG